MGGLDFVVLYLRPTYDGGFSWSLGDEKMTMHVTRNGWTFGLDITVLRLPSNSEIK